MNCALSRSFELELISWTGEDGRVHEDPTAENAFVINRENHWFTIRKIGNNWWNLDSLLDKPEHISSFYLSALLSQYRNEGCVIFLVLGNLPPAGSYSYSINDNFSIAWHRETSLLKGQNNSINLCQTHENRALDFNDVLRDTSSTQMTSFKSEDEDLELVMALSASMANDSNA